MGRVKHYQKGIHRRNVKKYQCVQARLSDQERFLFRRICDRKGLKMGWVIEKLLVRFIEDNITPQERNLKAYEDVDEEEFV